MKRYAVPICLLAVFEAVGISLWLTKENLFYLFNFSYIGAALSLSLALFIQGNRNARRIAQLMVGLYMLVYLGLISHENMQIEGFWYYLFLGSFEAATIHYAVAKIFGPLLFGRGWCGYACWTAMVLDFLPYPVPQEPRKKIGWIRYLTFAASLIFVAALFVAQVANIEDIMFWAFIAGNAVYYALGIALVQSRLGIELPEEEAANLAFHFANARSDQSGYDSMRYAKVMGSLVSLVTLSLNRTLDTKSIHYLRFLTHIKYFVERYFSAQSRILCVSHGLYASG